MEEEKVGLCEFVFTVCLAVTAICSLIYPAVLIIAVGREWGIYSPSNTNKVDPGHLLAFAGCVTGWLGVLLLAAIAYKLYAAKPPSKTD